MAESLNAAAKEKLPILFICIDNGRAINTFTPDVAQNSEVLAVNQAWAGHPGLLVKELPPAQPPVPPVVPGYHAVAVSAPGATLSAQ